MQHECKITVLETKVFPELQEKYLADPKSGPCPCFKVGDTFLLKRTPQQDDFYHLTTIIFAWKKEFDEKEKNTKKIPLEW